MMRIVIDLQAAQSSGSRNRGIGRYSMSLAQAMIRQKGEHEIIIALNGLFSETIEPIRAAFDGLLLQENIRIWYAPAPVNSLSDENIWRRKSAELIYEAFLASLEPDIVHVSSLFEGLTDDAVTSIGVFSKNISTAVTLYDLIPYINRKVYLENSPVEIWYETKIDHLRRADILLGISESARQEGIQYLGFSEEMTTNISTAADEHFVQRRIDTKTELSVRDRYGIVKSFVMYTGGIDHRKNIEGLIRAYAMLPQSVRSEHQLAVVCSVHQNDRDRLEQLARDHGLSESDFIMTGYIPEEDLLVLYNLCKLFVFPSWHEGFGLPALEAMCCGRATIGANTSSIPEVIGRDDALFDPRDDTAIRDKILYVLTDDAFRTELERYGLERSKMFSWDESAKRAIRAFEQLYDTKQSKKINSSECLSIRPRMAYISPLPPERSGISDYSVELLPELSRHYQIDVIVAQESISDPWVNANCPIRTVEWFREHSSQYDRVLYHFGNSHFHQHMFDLLNEIPGVVVLHDFFLSGIGAYMAHQNWSKGIIGTWEATLYASHGYPSVLDFSQTKDVQSLVYQYPCNKMVSENARSVIVHSKNSCRLADEWYGQDTSAKFSIIPHMRVLSNTMDKLLVRKKMEFKKDDFIVCSFGFIGPSKLNHRLLDAWLASDLATNEKCYLIFVGENHPGEYGEELSKKIQNSPCSSRIRITGWADTDLFRQHLAIADVGVQLRTLSRGETSGTVLDCMNYSIPTIVNANGSMADLQDDGVLKLSDEFTDKELHQALEKLYNNLELRNTLGQRAREIIQNEHSPRLCADQYTVAIEESYRNSAFNLDALTDKISSIDNSPLEENEWLALSESISDTFAIVNNGKQFFIDVSAVINSESTCDYSTMIVSMIEKLSNNYRVEPVYFASDHVFRYARQFTFRLLNCPIQSIADDVIEFKHGDFFFAIASSIQSIDKQRTVYQRMKDNAIPIYSFLSDNTCIEKLAIASSADGAICASSQIQALLEDYLSVKIQQRIKPYKIELLDKDNIEYCEIDAEYLINTLFKDVWSSQWVPDGIMRFFGSDECFRTQNGHRNGISICSTNKSGFLLFGPYISLSAGNYRVVINGIFDIEKISDAWVDIVVDKGKTTLIKSVLSENFDHMSISLLIDLKTSCSDLEIRVWVDDVSDITIGLIEIVPIASVDFTSNNIISNNLHSLDDSLRKISEDGMMNVENEEIFENGFKEAIEVLTKIQSVDDDDAIQEHFKASKKNKKQRARRGK
jgi:glycosyltransferase involved in cell wall biosynthesis